MRLASSAISLLLLRFSTRSRHPKRLRVVMDHGLHELDVFGGVPLRLERVELLGRESPGRFAWSSWLDDVRRGRPLLVVVGAGAARAGDHACQRHYQ